MEPDRPAGPEPREEEDVVGPVDAEAHERARLRGPRRLVRWGPLGAFVLAFASSATGADGRAGAFLLLLLLALTFGVGGLWVGGGLLLDEFRGMPTSRRRSVWAVALFVATLVCMTAVGGLVPGGA